MDCKQFYFNFSINNNLNLLTRYWSYIPINNDFKKEANK